MSIYTKILNTVSLGIRCCGKYLWKARIAPTAATILTRCFSTSFQEICKFSLDLDIGRNHKSLLGSISDQAGVRTQDPILKRDVLYRLSYLV